MNKFFNYAIAITILLMGIACSKKIANPDDQIDHQEQVTSGGKPITITATLSDALTRVSFTPDVNTSGKPMMKLAWEENDKLRVADHANHSSYSDFELDASCVGQQDGVFIGTPVEATSYDVWVIHGDVTNMQVQDSDEDASHIEYVAQKNEVSLEDLPSITFTDVSSVLGVQAKLPEGAAQSITSVVLTASEDIFFEGKTLTIGISNSGDTNEDGVLNLYATLPAGNHAIPTGTTLFVKFNSLNPSHTVYTAYREFASGISFASGALNNLKINCVNTDKYAGKDDDGSEAHPYLIADKYQMDAVDDLLKADETVYFRMVDDVDMSGITWVPLNNVADNNGHYSKYISFDGDNHTLSNITTNATSIPAYPSVFGVLNGKVANLNIDYATIAPGGNKAGVLAGYIGSSDSNVVPEVFNVHITNSSVGTEAARGTNYLGGVAAQIQKDGTKLSHVTIESSSVYGNLAENKTIGGMIAYIKCGAILEDCHSSALVNARAYVGGIVGFTEEPDGAATRISRCYVEGPQVTATYRYAGGIVGHANGSGSLIISDCYVTADVVATAGWAGGISGDHNKGVTEISNCYATGQIISSFGSGGIVGQVNADGLGVQKCAVFNAAIKATISDEGQHFSSGAIVAYAKGKKMTINNTYHKVGMTFIECPGNSENTLPTSNSGISWLNNQTVSEGAHQYIYPYHGRRTTMTLVALTRDTYSWSSDVWDFTGELPTLK